MFRLIKLKPPHGWNAVAWELAIVTLGVLIALGAQQVVQTIQWTSDVRETRKALDAELSRDLAAFDWRWNKRDCNEARLKELDRWATSLADGRPLALQKEITGPRFFAIRNGVWRATSSDVTNHMPLDIKLNYAGMYDTMGTFDEILRDEAKAWTTLENYQRDRQLSRPELRELRGAIADLHDTADLLNVFRQRLDSAAAVLKIKPVPHIDAGVADQLALNSRDFCRPLLAAGGR